MGYGELGWCIGSLRVGYRDLGGRVWGVKGSCMES